MNRAAIAEQRVFQRWLDFQDALIRAVTPQTTDQLHCRVLAGRRTAGEIAEHIHDLPHAGQLSMVLRASDLPGVEI